MGRSAVDSNIVNITGLPVEDSDVIGEVGKGFYYLLDGLNPERIVIGAEVGFQAADQALRTLGGFGYAKDYHVERLYRETDTPGPHS